MTPACPGEPLAVPIDPWKRIEIEATRNDLGFGCPVRRERDNLVDRFLASYMPFSNADNCFSIRRDAPIGVSKASGFRRLRCDRLRLSNLLLSIQSLVFEIRKKDHFVVNEVDAATILMRSRTHVKIRGRRILR